MKRSIQLSIIALCVAILASVAVGCKNTAHGMGQDIENAGEKIQKKTE
jgi:predicted small secreted protein